MFFVKPDNNAEMKSEENYGACSTKDKHENCIQVFKLKTLKGNDKFLDPDVDKRIILNCISKINGMRKWTEFISVRTGPVAGFYGLGNNLGCKLGEKLNHLRDLLTQRRIQLHGLKLIQETITLSLSSNPEVC